MSDIVGWDYTGNRLHPTQKPLSALRPLIESFGAPPRRSGRLGKPRAEPQGRWEMSSQKNNRIAELPAIDVIYETGEKGRPISEQAPAAFDRLEAWLPSLKGKKFTEP
jgi:hypothetical protein